jgi:hypothetical protein
MCTPRKIIAFPRYIAYHLRMAQNIIADFKYNEDIEKVVAPLRTPEFQAFIRDAEFEKGTNLSYFDIKDLKEIIERVSASNKNSLVHCIGAIVQGRTYIPQRPFSHLVVFLDQLDDTKYKVNGQVFTSSNIIQFDDGPLPIEVTSGRLALMVYSFKK